MWRRYVVTLVFFVSLFSLNNAAAQISFQRSDLEALIGQTLVTNQYEAANGQNAAMLALVDQTGPNQNWDFTTLTYLGAESSTENWIALPADLPASSDPRVADATYAIQIFGAAKSGVDQSVAYFQVTNSQHLSHGFYAIQDGTVYDQLYDSPSAEHPIPLVYDAMWTGSGTYHISSQGLTADYTVTKDSHVSGWGTLTVPGHAPVQALRLDVELTISYEFMGTVLDVTTTHPISFITKDGIDAEILIVPPPSGIGPTTYYASYAVTSSGGGSTEAPTTSPSDLVPGSGATVPTTPTLTWGPVDGAASYDLQVADNDSFTKAGGIATVIVDETGLTELSYDVAPPLDNSTTYFWRVRGANEGGSGPWSPTQTFTTVSNVAVEPVDGSVPAAYVLYDNYPNPFNPSTTIRFDLPESTEVRLSVFDALGRELEVLVSEKLTTGSYEVSWNAGNRPSGLYLYRLRANAFSQSGSMLLLK